MLLKFLRQGPTGEPNREGPAGAFPSFGLVIQSALTRMHPFTYLGQRFVVLGEVSLRSDYRVLAGQALRRNRLVRVLLRTPR